MNAIFQFDSSILLWIQNNLRSGFLTPIMVCITHLGDKGILWILLSLVLLFMYRTRRLGVVCAASMVLGLIVTNIILKSWPAPGCCSGARRKSTACPRWCWPY